MSLEKVLENLMSSANPGNGLITELKRLNDNIESIRPDFRRMVDVVEQSDLRNLTGTLQHFYIKLWGPFPQ